MRDRHTGIQLTLDFSVQTKPYEKSKRAAEIVTFVDAATIDVRRQAVQRLATSGVFAVPANLKCR